MEMRGPQRVLVPLTATQHGKFPTFPLPLLPGHQIPWELPRPPAGDSEGGTNPPGMSPGVRELLSLLIPLNSQGSLAGLSRSFHSQIPPKPRKIKTRNFPTEPGSPWALGRGTVPALPVGSPDPPAVKSWDPAHSQPSSRSFPTSQLAPNPSWLSLRGAQLASPPLALPWQAGPSLWKLQSHRIKSFVSLVRTQKNKKKSEGRRNPIWPGPGKKAAAALFFPLCRV